MDENTKHIVASNLTVAYFSKSTGDRKAELPATWSKKNVKAEVLEVYYEFLKEVSLPKKP